MKSLIYFAFNLVSFWLLVKHLAINKQPHRYLSLLNCTMLGLGSLLYLTFDRYLSNPEELKNDNLKIFSVVLYLNTFGLSYCLVDLVFNWNKINLSGKIHHFMMGSGIFIVITFDLLKPALLFFPIELSTIFLNFRSLFPKGDSRDISTFFFCLTFIVTRLIYLPYINYIVYFYYVKGEEVYLNMFFVISTVILQILQIYWMSGIINKFIKKKKVMLKKFK